jgi:hypothetical protein
MNNANNISGGFKVVCNRNGFLWAKDAPLGTALAIAEEEANENFRDLSVVDQDSGRVVARFRVIGDRYVEER